MYYPLPAGLAGARPHSWPHALWQALQTGAAGCSPKRRLQFLCTRPPVGERIISTTNHRVKTVAGQPEINNMALFCDFENLALGVRDAKYAQFDMKKVLGRLLLKGSIVVKKAYCDWERYKEFKAGMHEAAFELIEIPHVRQSGKNSADIRMVVDALDLCYTKAHVDTFVILSGDSDLREQQVRYWRWRQEIHLRSVHLEL
jgi:hypothetical protein